MNIVSKIYGLLFMEGVLYSSHCILGRVICFSFFVVCVVVLCGGARISMLQSRLSVNVKAGGRSACFL